MSPRRAWQVRVSALVPAWGLNRAGARLRVDSQQREPSDLASQTTAILKLGASVEDPADPMGKLFFNILATFAEFEADLIRMWTREGMAVARSKGKLRGQKPKLSDRQQKELRRMYDTGDYSISDIAEVFSISRPTVYRTLGRQPAALAAKAA